MSLSDYRLQATKIFQRKFLLKKKIKKINLIGLLLNAACCCCNLISLHGSRTLQEDVTNAAKTTLT